MLGGLSNNAERVDRGQIMKAAASMGVLGANSAGTSQILATLCDPEVSAKQVSAVVFRDPALYARVLRVANSSYYGQSRGISTLDRAIVVLGLEAVRGIAAAASLDRAIPRANEPSLIDMSALVRHSLATAAAAAALAQIHDRELGSEAFIAGLLHNLGIVVQLHLDRSGVMSIVSERLSDPTRDMRILEDERSIVGHEECIAVIFESWQLPESLIAATRHHHDPMSAPVPHRRLAALVNLGANLGLAGGYTFTLEPAPVVRNFAAMECLGLENEHLDAVAGEVIQSVVELQRALGAG